MQSRLIFGSIFVIAALAPRASFAQFEVLREGAASVAPQDLNPARGLVTRARMAYAYGGLNLNLSSGAVLQPFSIPLGFGYGIIENLEAGVEAQIYFNRPDPLSFAAFAEPRVWGRYAILPEMLAVEGSIFIPVGKTGDAFGVRLETPFRYNVTPELLVLAGATFSAVLGDPYYDFFQVGGAALYNLMAGFWVAVELGLAVAKFKFGDAGIPVGISAGYEVIPGLAILPGLRFTDITEPDYRVFQIIAAYTFDLAGGKTAEGSETPEIPLQ